MVENQSNNSKVIKYFNLEKFYFYVLIGVGGFLLPFEIFYMRFLYRDGSYMFMSTILPYKDFVKWDVARDFYMILSQWPVVFALQVVNSRNVTVLTYLYGIGVVYLPFIFLISTYKVTKDWKPTRFLGPLFCYLLLSSTVSIMPTEAIAASSLFWLVYVSILKLADENAQSRWLKTICLSSSILLLKIHEGSLLFFLFLIVFIFFKKFKLSYMKPLLFLIFSIGIILNLSYIIEPELISRTQAQPINEIKAFLKTPFVILLLLGLALILFSQKRQSLHTKINYSLIISILFLFIFHFIPEEKILGFPYFGRYFCFGLPFLVISMELIIRGNLRFRFRYVRTIAAFCFFLFFTSFHWNVRTTLRWNEFTKQFSQFMSTNSGLYVYEHSSLKKFQDINDYFEITALGILLSALNFEGPVRSVVFSQYIFIPYSYNPFEKSHTSLEEYGIKFTPEVSSCWGNFNIRSGQVICF